MTWARTTWRESTKGRNSLNVSTIKGKARAFVGKGGKTLLGDPGFELRLVRTEKEHKKVRRYY